jgi:hypothetical protein
LADITDENGDGILDEDSQPLGDEGPYLAGLCAAISGLTAYPIRIHGIRSQDLNGVSTFSAEQPACEREVQGTVGAEASLTGGLTKYEQYAILDEAADQILDEGGGVIYDEALGGVEVGLAGSIEATSSLTGLVTGAIQLQSKTTGGFYIRNKYTRKVWRIEYDLGWGQSSFTADLSTIAVLLQGTCAATASLSAEQPIAERNLLGEIAAAGSLVADLTNIFVKYVGSFAAESALTGQVFCERNLKGTLAAAATITGDITESGTIDLNGRISCSAALAASLMFTNLALGGVTQGVCALSGRVTKTVPIGGSIAASSSFIARLDFVPTGTLRRRNLLLLGVT